MSSPPMAPRTATGSRLRNLHRHPAAWGKADLGERTTAGRNLRIVAHRERPVSEGDRPWGYLFRFLERGPILRVHHPAEGAAMFGSSDKRRRQFIAQYAFPGGVAERLEKERPELSHVQRAQVMEGLRDWFQICREGLRQRAFVSMPSTVVDDAWHEFILFTRDYIQFCEHAFGTYLHHSPAEGLGNDAHDKLAVGLDRTWLVASDMEGIHPRAGERLPRIFALDEMVGAAGGNVYSSDDFRTELAPLKKRGGLDSSIGAPAFVGGSDGGGGHGHGCGGSSCGASCGGGGCGGG